MCSKIRGKWSSDKNVGRLVWLLSLIPRLQVLIRGIITGDSLDLSLTSLVLSLIHWTWSSSSHGPVQSRVWPGVLRFFIQISAVTSDRSHTELLHPWSYFPTKAHCPLHKMWITITKWHQICAIVFFVCQSISPAPLEANHTAANGGFIFKPHR